MNEDTNTEDTAEVAVEAPQEVEVDVAENRHAAIVDMLDHLSGALAGLQKSYGRLVTAGSTEAEAADTDGDADTADDEFDSDELNKKGDELVADIDEEEVV